MIRIIENYVNLDVTLSPQEKSRLAVNPVDFYGPPIAAFSKTPLNLNPSDYFCEGSGVSEEPDLESNDEPGSLKHDDSISQTPAESKQPVSVANNPASLFSGSAAEPERTSVEENSRDCCDCLIA